jgi:ApbE superfamily uncharacterized protein (UPF0280 family)
MSSTEDASEYFPIAYSTAYIGIAALVTIRANENDAFDEATVAYATRILELIKAQPDTVLTLPPTELEETGPLILDNAQTWLQ